VILIGFVPDEDLPSLYSLAEAFVFPSLYEGFGLPVLEAMGCGTPVVCSNTSSLPEVAGDAALLVAPTDVHGWVQVLQQITSNSTLRTELRHRGLAQAARFTWETAARQTLEVYRQTHDPSS
jgi:glycosyltransferase involved in cell wall biosynthesis